MGAAAAGYPLSLLVKRLGWAAFFYTLLATCAAAFGLLSPLGNAHSYVQRQAAAATAAAPVAAAPVAAAPVAAAAASGGRGGVLLVPHAARGKQKLA